MSIEKSNPNYRRTHDTIISKRGDQRGQHWTCNNGYLTDKFSIRSIAVTGDVLKACPIESIRQRKEDPPSKHCTLQIIQENDLVIEYSTQRGNAKECRRAYKVTEDGPTGDLTLSLLTTSEQMRLFNRLEAELPEAIDFLQGAWNPAEVSSSLLPDGLGWKNGITHHMEMKLSRIKSFIRGLNHVGLREKILDYAKTSLARNMPTRWPEAENVSSDHCLTPAANTAWILYSKNGSIKVIDAPSGWDPIPLEVGVISFIEILFEEEDHTLSWTLKRVKYPAETYAKHVAPMAKPKSK